MVARHVSIVLARHRGVLPYCSSGGGIWPLAL